MSNAVVYGKAAPLQVAGQLSKGYFFQNLGTSPIYVGYDTGVNSGYFDGVIQPGGTYTSGSGRAVWLYSDTDTPVVYNDDSGANANAGTNVTASIPGTLATTVQNPVALASGTAVGVSGSVALASGTAVGISGTATVKGTIDASGSAVNSTPIQTYLTVAEGAPVTALAPGSSQTLISNYDCSSYRSLIVCYDAQVGAAGNNVDLMRMAIRWSGAGGAIIGYENVMFFSSGKGYAIIPVKGPRALINLSQSGRNAVTLASTAPNYSVMFSTLDLPEYYFSVPQNSNGVQVGGSGYTVNTTAFDMTNGAVQQMGLTCSAAAGVAASYYFALPSLTGIINGGFGYQGGGSGDYATLALYHPVWNSNNASPGGLTTAPALLQFLRANGTSSFTTLQFFTFTAARAPLLFLLNGSNSVAPNAVQNSISFAYERF